MHGRCARGEDVDDGVRVLRRVGVLLERGEGGGEHFSLVASNGSYDLERIREISVVGCIQFRCVAAVLSERFARNRWTTEVERKREKETDI